MNFGSGAALRVGEWRVDPTSWQISRAGETMRVEARTMSLLLCLAERAGTIVSIEELLDRAWSGVVVTPDSVYQAIASLRRLLGDDAKQPAYIETVPRLGYRLVATVGPWVAPVLDSAVPAAALEAATAGSSSAARQVSVMRRSGAAALAYGAALGLVLLTGGLFRGELMSKLNGFVRASAPQKSVAVLPFLDLTSQQMNEEVFADGMTEELIDKLSKIHGVRVPPPTSSFYFKGKQLTVTDIAQSLDVAYVLDGSVRKSDATLRVAVRLIRADDGYVVWSETYDRPEIDKLALQDDIATQVAKALKASLT
jgi:transcriptional activator of cad operon